MSDRPSNHLADDNQAEWESVEIVDLPDAPPQMHSLPVWLRRLCACWLTSARSSQTRHSRQLKDLFTSGLTFLILATLMLSSGPIHDALTLRLFGPPPAPTPALEAGANLFYIQGSPPWGQLSIGKRPVSRLPRLGSEKPLTLPRGPNLLTWRAAPFKPITCTLIVPLTPVLPPCASGLLTSSIVDIPQRGIIARLLTFFVSLANLPSASDAALKEATQTALDTWRSQTRLLPGELYVQGWSHPHTVLASQPLQAELRFLLDAQPQPNHNLNCVGPGQPCNLQSQDCHLFCTMLSWQLFYGSSLSTLTSSTNWNVSAIIYPDWTYKTLTGGQIVALDQPAALGDAARNEHLVNLAITWDAAGWHVSVLPFESDVLPLANQLACQSAQDEVNQNIRPLLKTNPVIQLAWSYRSGARLANGCLVIAGLQFSHTAAPRQANFFYRCGVLFAANDVARSLRLGLPSAPSSAQLSGAD